MRHPEDHGSNVEPVMHLISFIAETFVRNPSWAMVRRIAREQWDHLLARCRSWGISLMTLGSIRNLPG